MQGDCRRRDIGNNSKDLIRQRPELLLPFIGITETIPNGMYLVDGPLHPYSRPAVDLSASGFGKMTCA